MNRVDQLLIVLAEEAAEVVQDTTKALRFGHTEIYQLTGQTNVERLVNELNDLTAIVEMLQADGVIPENFIDREKIAKKKARVEHFLKYSHSLGRLRTETNTQGVPQC